MTSKWDNIYIFQRPTSTGRKAAAVRDCVDLLKFHGSVPFLRSYLSVRDRRPLCPIKPIDMHAAIPHFGAHLQVSVLVHRSSYKCLSAPNFPFHADVTLLIALSELTVLYVSSVPTSTTLILTTRIASTSLGAVRRVPTLPSLNETIQAKLPQIIDDRHPLNILYIHPPHPQQLAYPEKFMTRFLTTRASSSVYSRTSDTRDSPTVVFFSHVLFGV